MLISSSHHRNSKTHQFQIAQKFLSFILLLLVTLLHPIRFLHAATVVGNLTDISLAPLNTKMMFTPATTVLLNGTGLNAGPPELLDTVNGAFSLVLDSGDYTVSLPLIPYRRPFLISVFQTNGTVNITNLLAGPMTYTYTNNLNANLAISASLAVDGALPYYDWSVLSNGVFSLPAWNSSHGQPRAPGLYFFNTNGNEMASLTTWADHGGASVPEMLVSSSRNIAIIPGGDGQAASGANGEVQLGYSGPLHDEFHLQYDDDYATANWTDGLGSYAGANNLGHSKRLEFRARTVNGSFAKAGIVGFSGGDNSQVSPYGLVCGCLRFYSIIPELDGSGSFASMPGVMVGEMGTNGWNLRGSLRQEASVTTVSASYTVDFSRAFAQVVDAASSAITFTTANLPGGTTNVQPMQLVIRTGPFTVAPTWPAWTWGNEAGTATAPASIAANKALSVNLTALGPDNTNVLATCTLHPWPFAYDPDASSFFTRATITDDTQKLAVHQLVLYAKAHGWWSKCDVIYPFVGGTASSHRENLKSSSYQITWSGTVTHDANGVTGNGSTGYGNTGFNFKNNGTAYTVNSSHVFVYGGTTTPTDTAMFVGGYRWTGTSSRAGLQRNGANLEGIGMNDNDGTLGALAAGTDFRGPLLETRTGSTVQALAVRSSYGTQASTTSVEPPNVNCAILARIDQDGTVDKYSNANLRAVTIGGAMSSSDWTTFRADWDNFENALGRKLP